MAMQYYNRYNITIDGVNFILPPFIKLDRKNSDKTFFYKVGISRLDKISDFYYNSPVFGWLILMANPNLPPNEFEIENDTEIIIPFPLNESLAIYRDKVNKSYILNGK